ncbi:MAG: hypothetical protein ABR608_04420, partial [Pseudonocardiaceae bacterium]
MLHLCLSFGNVAIRRQTSEGVAVAKPVVLKKLLREKHWQTYCTFCMQYDKAARVIDASLVGSYPSRAQLHRWQSGDVKSLPYPHHCRVLEAMFPGTTAAQMFSPAENEEESATRSTPGPLTVSTLLNSVKGGLEAPDSPHPSWCKDGLASGSNSPGVRVSFPLAVGQRTSGGQDADIAERIARSIAMLGKSMRLPDAEITELGKLAGNLVDLKMECSIDIESDGWAAVTYCHQVVNLTSRPMKRMTREQWFETTSGPLKIDPLPSSDRKVHIQRIHDT